MPAYPHSQEHPDGPESQSLLRESLEHQETELSPYPQPFTKGRDTMGISNKSADDASEFDVDLTASSNSLSLPTLGAHQNQMQINKPEGRRGDALGQGLIVGGTVTMLVLTWVTVLSNDPKSLGLFAYHPTLQTLAVSLFALGILTLQPTSQPRTKAAGLTRHQVIILGGAFPCIGAGTLIIIWNKVINESSHFTTWHGTFGIIGIVWMFFQMVLGAGSVWFGGALFGGGDKAKRVWKYHRLSGYVLFPLFLVTIHIAGVWSHFMSTKSSSATRIIGFVIAPLAILAGIWSRARLSKMKVL